MDIYRKPSDFFGKTGIEQNKDLFPYLTFRTHVTADLFFEAKTRKELIEVHTISLKHQVPVTLLGGGSNMAPVSSKIKGLVIKNSYIEYRVIDEQNTYLDVKISSGYPVSALIAICLKNGWEGFEYHKGLPGTLGGAIYMNSKWTRPWSYMGDTLVEAELLDMQGKLKKVKRDYFKFAYDYSILQDTKEVFIEGIFRLKKNKPLLLKERSEEAFAYRKKTQPFGVATAGCFFRNITEAERKQIKVKTTSAGYLIDQCGLKGYRIGDYEVSGMHANFIIHLGSRTGKPGDLLQLIKEIKKRVKATFGVELKEEVAVV